MDNKLSIINFLGKHGKDAYTMHELSKILHIPYATFYRTLQQMNDLLLVKTIGKSKVVQLKLKSPIVRAYLIIASFEERKEYLTTQPILTKIVQELDTTEVIVLFGSYAKRTETERSDIDILVINKNGKRSLSFSKYETLFNKKINPIFVTTQEFKFMLRDKEENVGKQVLQYHIVLNNPEEFWRYVLDVV